MLFNYDNSLWRRELKPNKINGHSCFSFNVCHYQNSCLIINYRYERYLRSMATLSLSSCWDFDYPMKGIEKVSLAEFMDTSIGFFMMFTLAKY